MKRIASRTILTKILSVVMIAAMALFFLEYVLDADTWVIHEGNPHVYSGGNISMGTILDRDGNVLLTNGSSRVYSTDEAVRKATLHLLGDRYGYISAPLINTYAAQLLNYNKVTGLYDSSETGNLLNLTISSSASVTALNDMGSRKGTVGVYNYKTGEILCMVSSGTYDPDAMPSEEEIESDSYYDGVYVNRFTDATYVPGSIFKLITAAAAIDTIPDVFERSFTCTQTETIGTQTITCENYHGTISFGTGLVKSCNIVFGELAAELGADTLTKYAQLAGVENSLSFDGTETASGNFDLSGVNDDGDIAWAGIGQYSDLINPCQFMTFVGSIANGGRAAKPYVVKSVTTPEGVTRYQAETTMLDQTVSASTASTLVSMMRDDVEQNYGSWNFPNMYVCAKSGTAEIDGQTPNAMFAGFLQDDTYPLAFIVIVENAGTGSDVCVPIASDVLSACVADMQSG